MSDSYPPKGNPIKCTLAHAGGFAQCCRARALSWRRTNTLWLQHPIPFNISTMRLHPGKLPTRVALENIRRLPISVPASASPLRRGIDENLPAAG